MVSSVDGSFVFEFGLVLLLQGSKVETIVLGEGDLGLLALSDHENVGLPGGEGLVVGILVEF